ncbi:MAG: response regulator [Anaerolineaceae bacterium]|nr:response regulator [Anaerolineaceae bacterium]
MNENSISVLLIEDNPGDARLIREQLRDATEVVFMVSLADNLQDGINALVEDFFQVVLLDLSLPDSFGLDTLQKIRSVINDVPIVVLTGFDDQTLGIQAVQMGAQDYLLKNDSHPKLLSRTIRYAIERHRIDLQLRQSQEEYRSLINDVFDTTTVGVLILDRDFKVVWVNVAIEVYFGIVREELLGHDKRLLIENKLKCIFEDMEGYASSLLSAYRDNAFDRRLVCKVTPEGDRQERWLEHWSQPIRAGIYAGGRIEHYTDITQRILIEASERKNAEKLAAAEERQRLARELHDSVSQTLFSSTVMAESALRQWEANPKKAYGLLEQLQQLTTSALAEMRLLLLELRPASLTQVGLATLIEQLAKTFQSRTAIEISTALDDIPTLLPDVQVTLYRTVQEALNNIMKHAQANRVIIRLEWTNRKIVLTITDDGKGFDMSTRKPSSLGMNIMQERAESINAALNVESALGEGTRIQVVWSEDSQ